jgi:hypothetical protein
MVASLRHKLILWVYLLTKVTSIEFALVEKDVIFGLKQGNQVLKDIQREMSLENVEKLMSETAEAIAYQRVWAALSLRAHLYKN